MEMEIILKFSPFNTEEKLMEQFAKIKSGMHNSCGPLIKSSRISLRFFFHRNWNSCYAVQSQSVRFWRNRIGCKNDLELSNIFINLEIV